MSLDIVVLAAGQGTRMRSKLPKVLHPVAGKPMLSHVLDVAQSLQPDSIHVVVGHGAEEVQSAVSVTAGGFVIQQQQLGTGHAVMQAMPALKSDNVLILYGDVPLITTDTLQQLLAKTGNAMALLTVVLDDATGYGRIVRGATGQVEAVVEHKDASPAQLEITECNSGILVCNRGKLLGWLNRLNNDNAQNEYYLTDIIAMAVADGVQVNSVQAAEPMEVQGANDRIQLAQLERFYQSKQAARLMRAGATLLDPARIDVRGEVTVGQDVLIDVNVILQGRVVIEDNVYIGANTIIKDSVIRSGAVIKSHCHLDQVEVGINADCGPFARLRPGTRLQEQAHVGNFVELKNTLLGAGAKVGHLSYLGDSEIGSNSNIGAGTITCNYDGANKHKTIMGQDVFIGSNSSIVAPVSIGDGATTGAGSTINQDIPANCLAVARTKQRNIDGWQRPRKKHVQNR